MASRRERVEVAVVAGIGAAMAASIVLLSGFESVESCPAVDADAGGPVGQCSTEVRWQLW